MDALEGSGSWQRCRDIEAVASDNATTLIGQTRDKRPPFSKADAAAITTPTLFIGGAKPGARCAGAAYAGGECGGFAHRDHSRYHASDVRTGAAKDSVKSCWSF